MSSFWWLLKTIRPKQWVKNIFIFTPLVFAHRYFETEALYMASLGFVIFSMIAGCVYILNDIVDVEKDRLHPKKKKRPLAAGKLTVRFAIIWGSVLWITAFTAAFMVNLNFFIIAMIYFILNVMYSLRLKNVVILDVLIIASGFVFRVLIGGEVTNVSLSGWIIIMTFLLSLFLGLIKRRQELVRFTLDGKKEVTRAILKKYNRVLLDQLISITTATILISYIVYVMSPEVINFHDMRMFYTIPFVIFGLFRYLYITYVNGKGESPEDVIFSDAPFTINIALWIITFIAVVALGNGS